MVRFGGTARVLSEGPGAVGSRGPASPCPPDATTRSPELSGSVSLPLGVSPERGVGQSWDRSLK